MRKGFTLVELLIIAAMLAILAATVVPSFLGAKSRAKIARAKNDLRTIDVALNAYMVDQKNYPYPRCYKTDSSAASFIYFTYELSTPIAYLPTTQMLDPFQAPNPWHASPLFGKLATIPYRYTNFSGFFGNMYIAKNQRRSAFVISSPGPDQRLAYPEYGFLAGSAGDYQVVPYGASGSMFGASGLYDPTNGSVSAGDIARFGGDLPPHPNTSDTVF